MPEREVRLRDVKLPIQQQDVISYEDDVFTWVYLDYPDRLLRYEAYVIGYDKSGRPTTLDIVIEEGMLSPEATAEAAALCGESSESWGLTSHCPAVPVETVRTYPRLDAEQTGRLHTFFEFHEDELKRRHRSRWIRRLKALGYDIVPTL